MWPRSTTREAGVPAASNPAQLEEDRFMKVFGAIALTVFVMALSSPALAQTPVRDGRWEITTEMDMPGMPMKMPAMKTTQCITKEQANDPNAAVPQSQDKNNACKVSDYKVAGNKVTWAMKCEGKTPMSGTGEITYATDSYDGWMKMTMASGDMTMKYKAKRLGDCVK
jgi:hypothetical protein